MRTFYCKTCNQKFDTEGIRIEWIDPIYGPCTKFTATCPESGEICDEFRPVKTSKTNSFESSSVPSCHPGGCSCCGG